MNEIWKDIEGFEGAYMASNFGNIKSVERLKKDTVGRKRVFPEKQITKIVNVKGYYQVNLYKNKNHTKTVARIVAKLFVPNPHNKPQVNHIDGNKQNNHVSNLEWVTAMENITHSIETGLKRIARGEQRPLTTHLKEKDIHEIRLSKSMKKDIAKQYNISIATVWNIRTHKTWKHI